MLTYVNQLLRIHMSQTTWHTFVHTITLFNFALS